MRDCGMQNFVYVAQKLFFVNFDLLRRLLYHHNLGVTLPKPAILRLNLEVAVLVAQLDPLILLAVL